MFEIIASYLPQFTPNEKNNEWHGPGFTEWVNTAKARPLFPGHQQPNIPGELGFYDLRLKQTQIDQAELARKYGITSFCYWHYWFGNGEQILNEQIEDVLSSGEPKFPFCFGWANESWYGIYHGVKSKLLQDQRYPNEDDIINHFNHCLNYFKDKRYTRIDGKPLFMIYKPTNHPEIESFIDIWQKLARENGLNGIYFVGQTQFPKEIDILIKKGFNAVNTVRLRSVSETPLGLSIKVLSKALRIPMIFPYSYAMKFLVGPEEEREEVIPTIIPNWDHSPRTGNRAMIYHGSNPKLFSKHVSRVLSIVKPKRNKIIFIKSWNEWGEGNYMEPDRKWQRAYLKKLKSEIDLISRR